MTGWSFRLAVIAACPSAISAQTEFKGRVFSEVSPPTPPPPPAPLLLQQFCVWRVNQLKPNHIWPAPFPDESSDSGCHHVSRESAQADGVCERSHKQQTYSCGILLMGTLAEWGCTKACSWRFRRCCLTVFTVKKIKPQLIKINQQEGSCCCKESLTRTSPALSGQRGALCCVCLCASLLPALIQCREWGTEGWIVCVCLWRGSDNYLHPQLQAVQVA